MNTASSFSAKSSLDTSSEQSVPMQPIQQGDSMTGFFAVGIIINIVMVVAFIIWAYKQWGQSSKRDS